MTDRERVMKELSWIINNFPKQKDPKDAADKMCNAINTYCSDALSLLKEREARVLEYTEIEKHPLVWLEDNDKEDVIPALFLQYNGWSAEFAVQDPDKYVDAIVRSAMVSAVEKMYGITWRAWTSHPTPEQMRDTPWEDSDEKPV